MSSNLNHPVIGYLLGAISTGFFLFYCRQSYLAHVSGQWRPVKATITEAGISTINSEGSATRYRPKIKYQYRVDFQTYVSERLSFNSSSHTFATNDEATKQFTVGDEITVYYDPRKPDRAVVYKGANKAHLAGPIGFLLFTLAIVYWYTR